MSISEQLLRGGTPNADWEIAAGVDLSALQYTVVLVDTRWYVQPIDPAALPPIFGGVLQNAPVLGDAAIVRSWGWTRVVYAGTVTAGDLLKLATGGDVGKVKKWTPGTDGHDHGAASTNPPASASLTLIVGQALLDGVASDVGAMIIMRQLL